MSAFTRKRLDVPEVHRLLGALDTMLDDWAETTAGSPERSDLWRRVHGAAYQLGERVYGGPALRHRIGYWVRPYDPKRDARCWRWCRLPCYALVLPDPPRIPERQGKGVSVAHAANTGHVSERESQ